MSFEDSLLTFRIGNWARPTRHALERLKFLEDKAYKISGYNDPVIFTEGMQILGSYFEPCEAP